MQLRKNNTKWIFFLGTSHGHEPENRHIFDLAYGVKCIEANGIQSKDIEIYIDGTNRGNIEKIIQTGTTNNYNIQATQVFFQNKDKNQHENSVIFVSGHGSHLGIDAAPPVSPHALLSCLKQTPNLKNSIVFLGQCYAGTFNYTAAGKKHDNDTNIILIGATSLHSSLSSQTSETFLNGQDLPWVANVFLLFVFKWLENPVDIDGDGKNTIIDCYKYAGCMANNYNKANRSNSFEQSIIARQKFIDITKEYHIISTSPAPDPSQLMIKKLELFNAQQDYKRSFDIYHTHQECWILNSYPAQVIEL